MSAQPRDINSAKPFESFYQKYREKGWLGTLPLPARAKEAPPNNFTGIKPGAKFVAEQSDIDGWLKQRRWYKGNICLRLGAQIQVDGQMWEVVGLDVDHYDNKLGGHELANLEEKYGKLPLTWISTSRTDGTSGIRFFLVPPGLAFRGNASASIETIQRRHRYAVVYPSWHPNGGQYFWYAPGSPPDGVHVSEELPSPYELPKLPDGWLDYMTNGRVQDCTDAMDNDISDSDLWKWLQDNLADGNGEMCRYTTRCFELRMERLRDATSHHEIMQSMHWQFVKLGVEGHTGWYEAIRQFNPQWCADVVSEGKRTLYDAQTETRRSLLGAARKIKGAFDEGTMHLEDDPCAKGITLPGAGDDLGFGVPPSANAEDPDSYLRNENGNAKFFIALYGDNVRYIANHPEGGAKWIVFNENKKRWIVDHKDVITRTLFREVEKRQIAFGQQLRNLYAQRANGATPQAAPVHPSIAQRYQNSSDDDIKKLAEVWVRWGTESGNKARVANSLAQATYYDEVATDFEQLDSDPYLLPVANGVIRFATRTERNAGKDPFEWVTDVSLCKQFLVTQNTNVPYIPLSEQADHENESVRSSYAKFTGYVEKFMKSHMSQQEWDYTRKILGYSVLGVNAKKAIFLYGEHDTGKSTLQNMLNEALGDLAIGRESRIFLDTNFKGSLAEALPRRMCMVGELGEKEIDASLFKAITGNDIVDCQLKNINKPVSMRARCTVVSSCNSPPVVPHADEATKARFVVIPFRHQVEGDEKDDAAQDDLMEHCKVSVLAWLIEACCDAVQDGIGKVPDELQMQAKQFVDALNEFSDFINDCIVKCAPEMWKMYSRNDQNDPRTSKPRWPDEECVGDRTMYQHYRNYAAQNGMLVVSSNMFTRRMKDAGFVKDGSWSKSNERRWLGIRLKNSERVRNA